MREHTHVVTATPREDTVAVGLSDGTQLVADRVVLATGYKADLARVPYLAPLIGDVATTWPVLGLTTSSRPSPCASPSMTLHSRVLMNFTSNVAAACPVVRAILG